MTYFRVKIGADYFHPKVDIRVRSKLNAKIEVEGSSELE